MHSSPTDPLITNDAVVLGLLLAIVAGVFAVAKLENPWIKRFFTVIPAILLIYFLPSLLTSLGIVDPGRSQVYSVAKSYLLPASLVFLTLSVDFPGLRSLGNKALIMFFVGTVGVILGGPLAILTLKGLAPDVLATPTGEPMWRGLSTVAGSWIGGSANQTAMKEVWGVSEQLFSMMVTIDVLVANVWMAFLLYGAGQSDRIDRAIGADNTAIKALQAKITRIRLATLQPIALHKLLLVLAIGFGGVAVAHLFGDFIGPLLEENAPETKEFGLTSGFFWVIILSTAFGIGLSFTPARHLEAHGASTIGSVFIYVLIATIGLGMDVTLLFEGGNSRLFFLGLLWMFFHVVLMVGIGRLIRAPFFFVAVGSQANIGGAASAPIVASAFHESLAPVGVLLAVLGYAVGTYGAWICALLMQSAS